MSLDQNTPSQDASKSDLQLIATPQPQAAPPPPRTGWPEGLLALQDEMEDPPGFFVDEDFATTSLQGATLAAQLQDPVTVHATLKFCLFCQEEGHFTNECHSTHGMNTAAARELHRLAATTPPQAARPSDLPLKAADKTNNEQGLYRKFEVQRTDGSSELGGKHHDCDYFVLDVTHDKNARAALDAYADAVAESHPVLASDMRSRYRLDTTPPSAEPRPISNDGYRELAIKAGAIDTDTPSYTPSPPVFPYWSSWRRFCDQLRATAPTATAPTAIEPQPAEPGAKFWDYRYYGSAPQKGYTIFAKERESSTHGDAVAYLGDGPELSATVDAICDAHNAIAAPTAIEPQADIEAMTDEQIDALVSPSGILHRDDGYYTWKKGTEPYLRYTSERRVPFFTLEDVREAVREAVRAARAQTTGVTSKGDQQ